MPISVKDVAAAAGVSVGTVSNVLNMPSKVAPDTIARVQRAIDELGFVRNDAARQLRAGRSRSIGLVVLDIANPFFAEVARGAQERAAEEGITVLLGGSDESVEREAAYLDLFREQRVNGVLVTPVGDEFASLGRLRDAGVPVVLLDREPGESGYSSVAVDDVEGGRLAVAHLIDSGRRRIAFVGGPVGLRQVADRLAGARLAVAERPDAMLEVVEIPALTVLHGRDAGRVLAARDRDTRPDAVFAANDLVAVGLLQAMSLISGLAVPDDVALIGYDDIDFAAATVVPLSSIRQPARTIGYTAADLLLRGDVLGRAVRYQPELIARASTGE